MHAVTGRPERVTAELRRQARETAASQAREIRLIAELVGEVEAAARAELAAAGPRVPGQPPDEEVVFDAVLAEVQGALGVGEWWAGKLVEAATRLTTVHTETLAAVESGRLDLTRARQLVAATAWLPDAAAQRVEEQVLAGAGAAPWAGPSPRSWHDRLARAIVRLAPDLVRDRRERLVAQRTVRTWLAGDGTGELSVTAADVDITLADEVITALGHAWPKVDPADPDGERLLSPDQRRVDALIDLLRRVRDGRDLPVLPVRGEHDIGLVLPADTFFADPDELARPAGPPSSDDADDRDHDDGPARDGHGSIDERSDLVVERSGSDEHDDRADLAGDVHDSLDEQDGRYIRRDEDGHARRPARLEASALPAPGQRRGPGGPAYLDPVSAVALARREIALGADTTVLLTNKSGALVGQVRLRSPVGGVWTARSLHAAVLAGLDRSRPPATDGYAPTTAQAAYVRARNPRCTGYDCVRAARRCDLDHDTPWPRGPTDVDNLAPRCRRHHEQKTRGLLRTALHPDGSVTTTTVTGLTVITRPEPLPGYGTGERRPRRLNPGVQDDAAA
jgi:hypothetical protein